LFTIFLWIVFALFAVATLSLAVYGLHLYVLLILFRRRQGAERERIDGAIRNGDTGHLADILRLIRETSAIESSLAEARRRADAARAAVAPLADSRWKDALVFLTDYSVSRRF